MKIMLFTALILLQSVSWAASELPVRGMSMEQVVQQLGEPDSRKEPVGNPPVTRWIYKDFSVYFEDETVIHSVRNRKKSIY